MAKDWRPIPLQPLNGPLDTRSRPADVAPGSFRWKLNVAINRSGKLENAPGFDALDFGDVTPKNWDHHRRTGRKPLTFLFETVGTDRIRWLFDGDENTVSVLNNTTSEWADIITGMGEARARWKADALSDQVLFTNDVDKPQIHTLGSGSASEVADLNTLLVTKAKIVLQFGGVMVLMNTEEDGERRANRVRWSDYRNAESWAPGGTDTVASFQDLDDGEEILACGVLGNTVYIFTSFGIKRMFIQVTTDSIFGFNTYIDDRKSRATCIAYENSLVATGKEFFYLGQSTIYWFNQYSTAPTSPDWLLNASGTMFDGPDRIDPDYCTSPVGWFDVDGAGNARSIWFSYPRLTSPTAGLNDYCLVLNQNTDSVQTAYQTAYYSDHGFTAFVTANRAVDGETICRSSSDFIGASGVDWCLKNIGGVFKRVMVALVDDDAANNILDADYATTDEGYYRVVRGMCPLGYPSVDKLVDNVMLDHDIRGADDPPNLLRLRIGNSYHLSDSNDDQCGIQWRTIVEDKPLACPDGATIAAITAEGQRPDFGTEWQPYEQGKYLYFEVTVIGPNGEPPVGGDSAWTSITFRVLNDPS